eukprot:SAG11_NODE_14596_length_606_cov_1.311637_1_plen_101_part_00
MYELLWNPRCPAGGDARARRMRGEPDGGTRGERGDRAGHARTFPDVMAAREASRADPGTHIDQDEDDVGRFGAYSRTNTRRHRSGRCDCGQAPKPLIQIY